MHAVWDGGTHAFILDTMVDPDFQRLGIGRDLVRTVTDEAFRAGCDWVHVDYEPEYAGFYENACGFRPTPARPRPPPVPLTSTVSCHRRHRAPLLDSSEVSTLLSIGFPRYARPELRRRRRKSPATTSTTRPHAMTLIPVMR